MAATEDDVRQPMRRTQFTIFKSESKNSLVTHYLDWKNGPEQVKLQIKIAFANLQQTGHLSKTIDNFL